MARDPVCGMNVDESKAQFTSEVNGQKVYYVENNAKESLIKSLKSMDTKRKERSYYNNNNNNKKNNKNYL